MEAGLLALCCVSAFASACLIGTAAVRALGRASAVGRTACQLGALGRVLRSGVGWMRPIVDATLRFAPARLWAEEAALALGQRGVAATPEGACSLCIASTAVLFAVAWTVSGDVPAAVAFAALVLVILRMAAKRGCEERLEEMRDAVPEALRSLGVCFQAGLSLLQTFRQTASELHGPLRGAFESAVHVLETGGTVPEALAGLRNGSSPELAFVAVALDIQHTSGGSMRKVLDAAGDSIAAEAELRRSMRVQTAQAKLSARVVSVMPFALIAVFMLTTKDFLAPFFQSAAGMALLALAVAMQASGILLVRRMLSVGEL